MRETLAALLPTVDNLERAIAAAAGLPEEDPMLSGVKMTLKQMGEAMNRLGLEPVGAVGEHFDPDKHNAVMRAEGEGEPGTVLEVLPKGLSREGSHAAVRDGQDRSRVLKDTRRANASAPSDKNPKNDYHDDQMDQEEIDYEQDYRY